MSASAQWNREQGLGIIVLGLFSNRGGFRRKIFQGVDSDQFALQQFFLSPTEVDYWHILAISFTAHAPGRTPFVGDAPTRAVGCSQTDATVFSSEKCGDFLQADLNVIVEFPARGTGETRDDAGNQI